jgi:pyruvate formate lyase activating enzyme
MYFLIHPYKVEGLDLMKQLDIWLEVRRLAVPEIDDDPRLEQTRKIGLEAGLRYAYVGNVPRGRLLIRRSGYWILENNVEPDQRCPHCGARVAGVGMKETAPS